MGELFLFLADCLPQGKTLEPIHRVATYVKLRLTKGGGRWHFLFTRKRRNLGPAQGGSEGFFGLVKLGSFRSPLQPSGFIHDNRCPYPFYGIKIPPALLIRAPFHIRIYRRIGSIIETLKHTHNRNENPYLQLFLPRIDGPARARSECGVNLRQVALSLFQITAMTDRCFTLTVSPRTALDRKGRRSGFQRISLKTSPLGERAARNQECLLRGELPRLLRRPNYRWMCCPSLVSSLIPFPVQWVEPSLFDLLVR